MAAVSDSTTLFRVALAMEILGFADEALLLAEHRIRRDPLNWATYNEAWRAAYVSGDLDSANEFLERGLALGGRQMFSRTCQASDARLPKANMTRHSDSS